MEMITIAAIDWSSFGVGAGLTFLIIMIIYYIFKLKRKPKHNLQTLRTLVYETGIKTNEVYKNIKELEKVFKDMESS